MNLLRFLPQYDVLPDSQEEADGPDRKRAKQSATQAIKVSRK
jgi:hypothetical protein